eukprot:762591-Hanusia_phi.AAC.3
MEEEEEHYSEPACREGSRSRSDPASAVFSAAYTMTSPRATGEELMQREEERPPLDLRELTWKQGHIAFDESRLFVSGSCCCSNNTRSSDGRRRRNP